ncbi:hypothetical protein A2368_01985 [Candidatus Collierbacteria bacterium RIFOXYB1_FULL_49_13]|uniref:Uncharacterized protein n=1 Tax=Candidatus Collierbacteria bacterium RIFOXYB1_FULL_49_13 TaxID=1817728 RepID=A0A1F5FGE7_9BACT|nr:MAG: hypothetical protein A2368_01985 [Candidatus Collierbacteria bacterium RIFOXYB1_FULL_49_13]
MDTLASKLTRTYWPKHQTHKTKYTLEQIKTFNEAQAKLTKIHYSVLSDSRTCDEEAYINYWLHEENITILVTGSLTKITTPKQPLTGSSYQAVISHFNAKHPIPEVHAKIEDPKLIKKFPALIKCFRQKAMADGYQNYPARICEKDGTPTNLLKPFLALQLPKPNQGNCPICLIKDFPKYKLPLEPFFLITREYPILNPFVSCIKINPSTVNNSRYFKDTDSFEINYNSTVNTRHQFFNLLHEICHIVTYLELFQKHTNPLAEGKYFTEKDGYHKQLTILKKLDPKIYKAFIEMEKQEAYTQQQELKLYFEKSPKLTIPLTTTMVYSPLRYLAHAIAFLSEIQTLDR